MCSRTPRAPTQDFRLIVISINRRRLEITLCYTSDSTTLLNRIRTITGLLRYSANDENGGIGLFGQESLCGTERDEHFGVVRDRCWKCRKEKCARKTFVEKLRSFVPFARTPDCRWAVYVNSRRRPKVSNAQIAAIRRGLGEPPTGGRRCSSRYSRYGVITSSIHFMNARTRRDRLLRCATTRETASARRR